jgi:hypothetical protein
MSARVLDRWIPGLFTLAASIVLAGSVSGEEARDSSAARDSQVRESRQTAPSNDRSSTQVTLKAIAEKPERTPYKPPRRGSPRAKVSGAMRGALAPATPLALAPDRAGFTAAAQPTLFWHIDRIPDESSKLVFTLIAEDAIEPLIEAELERPNEAGIHGTRLTDHHVSLEAGVAYEWSVSLVTDEADPSQDSVSSGSIRRLTGATTDGKGEFWYDSLEMLLDTDGATTIDAGLVSERLVEVGLDPGLASDDVSALLQRM